MGRLRTACFPEQPQGRLLDLPRASRASDQLCTVRCQNKVDVTLVVVRAGWVFAFL